MNEDIPGDLTSSSMQNKRRKLQPIMGENDKKSFPLATTTYSLCTSVLKVKVRMVGCYCKYKIKYPNVNRQFFYFFQSKFSLILYPNELHSER